MTIIEYIADKWDNIKFETASAAKDHPLYFYLGVAFLVYTIIMIVCLAIFVGVDFLWNPIIIILEVVLSCWGITWMFPNIWDEIKYSGLDLSETQICNKCGRKIYRRKAGRRMLIGSGVLIGGLFDVLLSAVTFGLVGIAVGVVFGSWFMLIAVGVLFVIVSLIKIGFVIAKTVSTVDGTDCPICHATDSLVSLTLLEQYMELERAKEELAKIQEEKLT